MTDGNKSTKVCYYEILGIEQRANDKELKKAYYALALKYHPDKQQQQQSHTTEYFQEIQNAYEVLSDPIERKWYDEHRDQILGEGDEGGIPMDDLCLWKYFGVSAFKGYKDDENGFYSVYRNVFNDIANLEKQEDAGIPDFGDSNTNYEQVELFYRYWSGYCSSRNFSWCDKYRVTDASNRRERRLMEKLNNKERSEGKKEYTNTVRRLVEFIKKKDLRVLKEQSKIAKKNKELKEKEEREKEIKVREYQIKKEEYLQQKFEEWDHEDEEKVVDGEDINAPILLARLDEEVILKKLREKLDAKKLYCTPCKKGFRSMNQLENHRKSNKHKDICMKAGYEEDITQSNDSSLIEEVDISLDSHLLTTNVTEKEVVEVDRSDHDLVDSISKSDELKKKKKDKEEAAALKRKLRKELRKEKKNETGISCKCVSCGLVFSTRNQLHKHIQEEGHAKPL